MHKITSCIIAVFIIHSSLCAQGPETVDPLAPGENIYKHFTGTIGKHKAVLDLRYGFQGASNYGGSTYYFSDEDGLNYFLISQPPTFSHNDVFRAQVFPENIPLSEIKNVYSIYVQTPRFEFTLSHDSLLGKWFNPNGQEQLKITLTEDRTNALPFEFKHAADSAAATGKKNAAMKAVATYRGIQSTSKIKEKDAVFIYKAVLAFMGNPATGAKDWHDLYNICLKKFLADFNASVNSGSEVNASNFSGNYTLFPVYNDNGFLVLQKGGFQYLFDTKEYTDRNLYLCLDVKDKKVLKLDDILTINNDALTTLLEKTFRKKYQLEPGKKLSDLFTTDKMPFTDNFTLANKGLIFSYSPSKIFRDDQDIADLQEMRIFLSYDDLAGLLKPEFKTRVGVK